MMDMRRLLLPTSSRVVFIVALLASTTLLLAVIAHWGVQLAAPRSAPRPPMSLPTPTDATQAIVSRHLFGIADRTVSGGAGAALVSLGAVRLLGVASSGPSGGGFAIVSVNGKAPVPAVEGREFAPGARLNKVTASGIEYEFGGVVHRAALQAKSSPRPASSSDNTAGVADHNRAAVTPGRAVAQMPSQLSTPAESN